MLSFIFGRCGSGKTYELYKRMEHRASRGERSLLLVPEQFTSSVELNVLERFDDRLGHYITVADFGRIARMTQNSFGGRLASVGDAYRVALCRRAVDTLKGQLKYYTADSYSPGFYALCAEIIKELKMSCTPCQLEQAANSDKLRDLSLIYRCYDEMLSGRREPQDSLLFAAECIENHSEFLCDTAVFIDGFDGFTAPEYSMLSALFSHDKEVCVTMCMPSEHVGEQEFFETVHLSAKRLMRLAERQGCALQLPHTVLFENRRSDGDLEILNLLLCGEPIDLPKRMENVTITPYEDASSEVLSVAAAIHADIRGGARYRDIAVVMRSTDDYYGELIRAFNLFDIPVYLDRPNELRFCASAKLVSALLSLKMAINTDDILTVIGTGLCDLSQDETATLQDWILRFNPHAKEWRNGIETTQQDAGKRWDGAEPIRARLIEMLAPLYDKELAIPQALYETIMRLGVPSKIEGEEEIRQYNLVISIIDQLHSLTEQWETDVRELAHLYTILLQNTKLHSIPRVKDSVSVYEPDRIVGDGVKILYMLGVNSTVFPAEVGASGLLNHTDREQLAGQELLLPGLYINRVMLEDLYFYRTVCTPSERLHISYITKNGAKPSAALLPIIPFAPRHKAMPLDRVATVKSASVILSKEMTTQPSFTSMIEQSLTKLGHGRLMRAINSAAQLPCFNIVERENIDCLLEGLSLSSGKISGYKSCSFSFLMQYLLQIEPVRRLELSADIAGIFIHTIMELILKQHPELSNVSAVELAELCEKHSEMLTKKYFGDTLTTKDRFIVSRLAQSALQLILFLQTEQQSGLFRPERFEVQLNQHFETPCGINLTLKGKVDRMDGCVIDGERYIRVVDYKTGTKLFSLKDVMDGIDIQLFLYLFYAKSEQETPAGAFYLHNRPSYDGGRPTYRYDGAALAEPKVLDAMGSEYVKVKLKADGSFSSAQENRIFDRAKAGRIKKHIDELINEVTGEMNSGHFDALPFVRSSGKTACEYCGYRIICRKSDGDCRERLGSDETKPFAEQQ